MNHPIDIFAAGARDGVYPGGQLCASREMKRLVTASVGKLGPGMEPTGDQVVYDLASLTKPLATTLLLGRALEAGLCKLEDPVVKYVPGVHPSITLLHLLEHSSGYPAHARFDQYMPRAIRAGSWDAWRHIVFEAVKLGREAPAGYRAVYSDVGFILLGAALEVMHSKALSVAFGLLGTPLFFRDKRGPPALPPVWPTQPIAPTENCHPGDVHDENCRAMGGAAGHAGLFGTAEGVLTLAEQLVLAYHGFKGGVLKPETIRRIWQPSLVPGSTRTIGWDRPSPEGSSTGGRWPPQSVGHLGFTGTSIWIEPDRALIVVLVTNRVCPTRANNTIRRLRPALYDAAWDAWGKKKPKPIRTKTPKPRKRKAPKRFQRPARAAAARSSEDAAHQPSRRRRNDRTERARLSRQPHVDDLHISKDRAEGPSVPPGFGADEGGRVGDRQDRGTEHLLGGSVEVDVTLGAGGEDASIDRNSELQIRRLVGLGDHRPVAVLQEVQASVLGRGDVAQTGHVPPARGLVGGEHLEAPLLEGLAVIERDGALPLGEEDPAVVRVEDPAGGQVAARADVVEKAPGRAVEQEDVAAKVEPGELRADGVDDVEPIHATHR